MNIVPLTGALGAEILDSDVTNESRFQQIFEAFVEYSVIAIRDQHISPEQLIRFAQKFGNINVNRFFTPHTRYPEIAMVIKEPHQKVVLGGGWHTDNSYDDVPCRCSILHGNEVPRIGGDTVFASMSAAFDALSESMKTFLRGLWANHSAHRNFSYSAQGAAEYDDGRIRNAELATQEALHPVVIKHPLSGKECLFVNLGLTTHIENLHPAESKNILKFLYGHGSDIRFTCRINHLPGTITIWDNQATWHRAIDDYSGYRRVMHRISVEGVPLEPSRARNESTP